MARSHKPRGPGPRPVLDPPKPAPRDPLAESADQVFDKYPKAELIVHNSGKMAPWYLKSLNDIAHIAKKVATEESANKDAKGESTHTDGSLNRIPIPPYNGFDPWKVTYLPIAISNAPEYQYEIQLLPDFGAFVLEVKEPSTYWTNLMGAGGVTDQVDDAALGPDGTPVLATLKILCRLSDLYVMGYFSWSRLKWRLFADMKMEKFISGININKYCQHMEGTSSYTDGKGIGVVLDELWIGREFFTESFRGLVDDRYTKERQLMIYLGFFCFTISEASRRRYMSRRVYWSLKSGVRDKVFSGAAAHTVNRLIHNWESDCRKISKGFVPSSSNLTDEELAIEMSQHLKRCRDISIAKVKRHAGGVFDTEMDAMMHHEEKKLRNEPMAEMLAIKSVYDTERELVVQVHEEKKLKLKNQYIAKKQEIEKELEVTIHKAMMWQEKKVVKTKQQATQEQEEFLHGECEEKTCESLLLDSADNKDCMLRKEQVQKFIDCINKKKMKLEEEYNVKELQLQKEFETALYNLLGKHKPDTFLAASS